VITTLGGELIIAGNTAFFTTLSGLNPLLNAVGGNLHIENNAGLTSLTGLGNIASVGGDLRISLNPGLTNLSGLGGITSIGGSLNIDGAGLTSLNGLSPMLTSIPGSLSIGFSSFGSTALTTLNGLGNITSIGGALSITGNPLSNLNGLSPLLTSIPLGIGIALNPNLTSLTGLNHIASAGSLEFFYNNGLVSLSGLSPLLSYIPGSVTISGNASLVNLSGLEYLTEIGGGVGIYSNDILENLEGLNNLHSIAGTLVTGGNGALINLGGLDNLAEIGGGMQIDVPSLIGLESLTHLGDANFFQYSILLASPALTSLAGLDNLTTIDGSVSITYSPFLTNLGALSNVSSFGGNILEVSNNATLSNLQGLDNFNLSNLGVFRAYNSPNLSLCHVPSVCAYLENGGYAEIFNNAPECNSVAEVQTECQALLPLELLDFEVFVESESNRLDWRSASETKFSHFEIERSADGATWAKIGSVPGLGNTTAEQFYQFTDKQPLPLGYYRLRMVDLDGSAAFSKIVSADRQKQASKLRISPNPFSDQLFINLYAQEAASAFVSLTDVAGKVIWQMQIAVTEGSNRLHFDLPEIPQGIYMLQMKMPGLQIAERVARV